MKGNTCTVTLGPCATSTMGTSWAEMFPQVTVLATALRQAADPDRQASLVMQLVLLFKDHPEARKRLREALETSQRRSHGDDSPATVDLPTALDGLVERLNSPVVTRYTDITAPRHLAPGRRGVITVRLTCAPLAASAETRPVRIRLAHKVDVYLHARSEDVEVEGAPVHQLRIEPDHDSETVVFFLTALRAGDTTLRLDFRQAGLTIATVELPIEVSAETASDDQTRTQAPILLGGAYAPPPDLDLRVTVSKCDEHSVLSYVLHSPNGVAGYHFYPAGEITFRGSPEQFQARLMTQIEEMTGSHAQTTLRKVGEKLYRELFPAKLRSAYRDLSTSSVRSLQITSDEPWIPWELVRPYDDDDPGHLVDDDFLCARFELTRWLAGRSGPVGSIQISSLAYLDTGQAAEQPPLPSATRERGYLASLADRHRLTDLSPPHATGPAIEALLDRQADQIDLWYFAGHGDVSEIVLADGSLMEPDDLYGHRQTTIRRRRPLVFFNACRVSQQTWSLTKLGGWASAWVGRCRCGVFAGPLWSVTDRSAWIFARTFYEQLETGRTIGQAVLAARAQTRKHAPKDPTWMAYSVYAHPNARVVFTAAEHLQAAQAPGD